MDFFLKKIRIGISRYIIQGCTDTSASHTDVNLKARKAVTKSHTSLMEHESNDFRNVLEFMEVNPRELIKVSGSLDQLITDVR